MHMAGKHKVRFALLVLFAILVIASLQSFNRSYANPDIVPYYPSGQVLLGSTALVSGTVSNLQNDDGVYSAYRSYVSATPATASTNAFAAYRDSTATLNTPKQRTWNGSVWGSQSDMPTSDSPVRSVRVACCPLEQRSLERAAVTLSDDGYLDACIWDGTSWNVTNNLGQTWTAAPATADRPFDVAYESLSGDILLVYGTTVAGGTSDLAYRVWKFGTGWGPEQYYDDADHPTKVTVTFVILTSDPTSDKIGLAYIESTNNDANALIWNGTSLSSFVEITGTIAIATEECAAIAFEGTSGACVAVAGEGQFVRWTRFTTSWSNIQITDVNTGASGAMNWLRLAQAQNNRLMLTSVDGSTDLTTALLDEQSIGNRQWETASESIGSMTSTTSVTAMRFTAQTSNSVSNILVYIQAAAASPAYRFGIETSTAAYLPSGTYVGGTSNYAVVTPSSTGWLNVSLPAAASLTSGTVYHITVRYNSGTIGASNYIALRRLGPNMNDFRSKENTIDPWLNTISGTTLQNRDPVFALKHTDGTFESMPYDTASTQNIYGSNCFSEKWTQNGDQTILGVNIPLVKTGIPPDNLYIVVRNETDAEDVATMTVAQGDISTTLQWYERYFASAVRLTNGKTYRLILRSPSSTSSNYFSCSSLSTGQAGSLTYGGLDSIYSSSTNGGVSWTDTNTADLTYIALLSNAGSMGWVIHPPWDTAVDTDAQRCADFAWEYRSAPDFRNQGLLVYGTTSGSITWRRFRAPNYMTSATSPSMTGGIHPWVQLKSNPRTASGDTKILGLVLTGTIFDIGAVKWDGSTFTVIGTNTISSDTTVITYECFEFEFQLFGEPTQMVTEVEFTGSSNTELWQSLTWAIDSAWTTGNVATTLQLYDYAHNGYPTIRDGYISYTSSATPYTDETKSQTITSNPTNFRDGSGNWRAKIKGVKNTNTQFDFEADLVKYETTIDTNHPIWSNENTNNTIAGRPTLFSVKWNDDFGLSGFIFGSNNTATWVNDTWTPMSGLTDWSNVTRVLNSTADSVQWNVWANDTSNNWNNTGPMTLDVMQLPVASFTYSPSTPKTGETVTSDASTSYDPDGTIVSYFWTFGDGSNGTGMITNHVYSDNGTYNVTLKVTDNDNLTETTNQSVTVLNRPPIASFTESASTVPTGTPIYFNASSSYDPDGTVVSYFWTFGDGTIGTGVTITHSYGDNGTYVVTLIVTDDDGATATANATKTILNQAPTASFTESAETEYTNEIIYFNASASHDPDGSIISYYWNFGDGTNTTGVNVQHSYAENGSYLVTLTVTDNDGASSLASATKTILNRLPIASFSETAHTVYTGETFTFNA